MATKRARISDRNPLTATDGVIAGYEQVNKSASQIAEVEGQQDSYATSEQVNKLGSQQVNKTNSKQASKSASQNELAIGDSNPDNLATEEVSKLTSQLVENSVLTSQEPDNLASQEVDNLDLGSNSEDNKSTSQQPSKPGIQKANELDRSKSDKSASKQPEKLASQQVSKPIIRKATFQVDAAILADLDRYHLQLQIEMGRRNAPYKEILVEEAIAQWLERAAKSPDRAVKSLLKRQEQR
jgi:translation elongation factor EF-Ts